MVKICGHCGATFVARRKDKKFCNRKCKDSEATRHRIYTDKDRISANKYLRFKTARMRREIVCMLGASCASCGLSEYDVLEIDHVVPFWKVGNVRGNTYKMMKEVYRTKNLDNLQVLCANCHRRKTNTEIRSRVP